MQREILFRGKSINNGKWFQGDLLRYAKTAQIWYDTDDGKWNCLVDPATVGQYTGLKDKLEKKIFEGDIVEFFGMRGEIVQECGAFGVGCRKPIVLIDKLEELDLDTLREFGEWAEGEGLQIIGTRVSTGPECTLYIDDGYSVLEPEPAVAWKAGEF